MKADERNKIGEVLNLLEINCNDNLRIIQELKKRLHAGRL